MSTTIEQREVAGYVAQLMARSRPNSTIGRVLRNWLARNVSQFELQWDLLKQKAKLARKTDKRPKVELLWEVAAWEMQVVANAACEQETANCLEQNLVAISRALSLSSLEQRAFRLALRYSTNSSFEDLCDEIIQSAGLRPEGLLATLLDEPRDQVIELLQENGLYGTGLLRRRNYLSRSYLNFNVAGRVLQNLNRPHLSAAALVDTLLGVAKQSDLRWSDFDHIAADRNFVARLLAGALKEKTPGVNIFIHGDVGVGKSELCVLLAKQANSRLYGVGECGDEFAEPTRRERLSELQLSQRLSGLRPGTILLFDEMEDLLSDGWGSSRRQGSKVFFNRLLENNPTPVLWVSNRLDAFDPAFLRRMSYVVDLRLPPVAVRRRIFERAAAGEGVFLTAADASKLAREIPVAPAIIASAAKSSRLAMAAADGLTRPATAIARAVNGGTLLRNPAIDTAILNKNLLNTDQDLNKLERALADCKADRDFSLCLIGPPGCGKSAYAWRLAEVMAMEVKYVRYSDLASKWLGEMEQNIAAMFRDAIETESFLLIDEIDALLGHRAGAEKSWEISSVNEILSWLERHPLPVAATTNLVERIDPAALRRFTFKVKFDYLDPAQITRAFQYFFSAEAPTELSRLPQLTPSDFANVKKQLRFLPASPEVGEIAAMLRREVLSKPEAMAVIGF